MQRRLFTQRECQLAHHRAEARAARAARGDGPRKPPMSLTQAATDAHKVSRAGTMRPIRNDKPIHIHQCS